jgi:hypothetical protein
MHIVRLYPAQQTVTVQSDGAEATVDLVVPVGEAGVFGQVLGLYDTVAAQAAAVHFLQADNIKGFNNVGNAVEIWQAFSAGPYMTPTTRKVIPIRFCADSGLDVETGQPEMPPGNDTARSLSGLHRAPDGGRAPG